MTFNHVQNIVLLLLYLLKVTLQTPSIPTNNLFRENPSCECGAVEEIVVPRIVGGYPVENQLYPWMVAIMSNGRMHCGGSLISDRYVLTAGHCLNWLNKEDLIVLLRLRDRVLYEKEGRGGIQVEIDKMIVHEDFTSDYLHDTNDIALIRLKKPLTLSQEINPVCLPSPDFIYPRRTGMIAGWGRTTQNGSTSRLLRKANVRILANEECTNITSIGEHIKETMFCAYEFGVDACQGDSGGPLLHEQKDGRMEQIGIVSWGIGCARPGVPGIYTRITSFLEWIALHTKDSSYCHNPSIPQIRKDTNSTNKLMSDNPSITIKQVVPLQ